MDFRIPPYSIPDVDCAYFKGKAKFNHERGLWKPEIFTVVIIRISERFLYSKQICTSFCEKMKRRSVEGRSRFVNCWKFDVTTHLKQITAKDYLAVSKHSYNCGPPIPVAEYNTDKRSLFSMDFQLRFTKRNVIRVASKDLRIQSWYYLLLVLALILACLDGFYWESIQGPQQALPLW